MPGLRRSKTLPAGSGLPLAGARRAKSSMARQRSLRKTAQARARATIASATAVKAIIMSTKEDKYMNVRADVTAAPLAPLTGPNACSVIGYATTGTTATGAGVPLSYGGRGLVNMNMLRPMNPTLAGPVQGSLIDGNEVAPTLARSMFTIQRMSVPRSASSSANPEAYRSLPIRCRIIRCTPKLAPGTQVTVDPSTDLFVNQFGEQYGVTSTAFTMSDLEYAIVNNRLWTTLEDKVFTMKNAPLILSDRFGDAGSGITFPVQLPVTTEADVSKRVSFNHQLTDKKNGTVYFKEPQAATTLNADSGHRREYVFMHFWWLAADGMNPAVPPGGADAAVNRDVLVHSRFISKFKDV